MELWGGHECTVNRVGDRYRDQTRLTGHQHRLDDLARFAELGITKLRYPVLWERVSPRHPDERNWRWSDERLAEIDRLGMTPIVGLLHHGSGPHYTSLVCDRFVDLFAGHAAATARRYPHVTDWTPVNEPLTTARFSALYGHWYPHAQDEPLFWRALLNQVDGTRAAMRAIRRENPDARLIQTEDLGETYSTPELAETAAHYNLRRWATWDLLAGTVTPGHPLWSYLERYGLQDRLRAIADDPCPPDVIGVNYYPTSERFLDHRLDRYPQPPPATGYHDVAAVRVLDPPSPGLAGLLRQTWDRYRIPIAVTECHLGCTREEQLRWLWQGWRACRDVRAEGADIRAFTAWALLGNVDWSSLLTREADHYEPGVFDIGGGSPRPTALAHLLAVLARGDEPSAADFPVLAGPGWWERTARLEYASYPWSPARASASAASCPGLLIAGDAGPVELDVAAECELRGLPRVIADHTSFAIGDQEQAGAYLDRHKPWAVIHVADSPSSATEALIGLCAARNVRCLLLLRSATGRIAEALSVRGTQESSHDLRAWVRAALDLLIDGERGAWRIVDGVAQKDGNSDHPDAHGFMLAVEEEQPPTKEALAA